MYFTKEIKEELDSIINDPSNEKIVELCHEHLSNKIKYDIVVDDVDEKNYSWNICLTKPNMKI